MHVAVIPLIVGRQRIDDRAWLMGGSGVIEINQRVRPDVLVQDWKIFAHLRPSTRWQRVRSDRVARNCSVGAHATASGCANASNVACQESVAHLIRAGYACTPANAASSV